MEAANRLSASYEDGQAKGQALISWSEERSKLEEFLRLKGGTISNLTTGIAILTPLAGSAVSLFIGK